MSRRAPHFTGEKTAVANSYVEATNMIDLGASADPHRVKVTCHTAVATGADLFMVASPTALTGAQIAAQLADAAQRIRIRVNDVAIGGYTQFEHTYNYGVRFLYFLTSSSTANVSVVADEQV